MRADARSAWGPASGDQDVLDDHDALLGLREWLVGYGVTMVAMEATGVYWKPVYYLLEDVMTVQLLNAAHMRNVPGRKTDVTDTAWIARLVEHGLVRPSFVPPPVIRRLRDLTRYRASLVAEHPGEAARGQGPRRHACIELSAFVADIFGSSGRAMLHALIDGERDPQVLADFARSRMRQDPRAGRGIDRPLRDPSRVPDRDDVGPYRRPRCL